jgi:hypothetical protein
VDDAERCAVGWEPREDVDVRVSDRVGRSTHAVEPARDARRRLQSGRDVVKRRERASPASCLLQAQCVRLELLAVEGFERARHVSVDLDRERTVARGACGGHRAPACGNPDGQLGDARHVLERSGCEPQKRRGVAHEDVGRTRADEADALAAPWPADA